MRIDPFFTFVNNYLNGTALKDASGRMDDGINTFELMHGISTIDFDIFFFFFFNAHHLHLFGLMKLFIKRMKIRVKITIISLKLSKYIRTHFSVSHFWH